MFPSEMVVITIIHAFIAALSMTVNLIVTHKRLKTTTIADGQKLRLAIACELVNLRDAYKDNVDALYACKDVICSSRLLLAIYRGNLGKLNTLEGSEIPAVVTAYAASERAEAFAAAHGKAHGQSAFSLGKERPFLDDLIAYYEKATAAADRALRAMSAADRDLAEMLGSGAHLESGAPSISARARPAAA
jgi:hypothetical protein